LVQNGAINKM